MHIVCVKSQMNGNCHLISTRLLLSIGFLVDPPTIRSEAKDLTTTICLPSVLVIVEDGILVKLVIIPVMLKDLKITLS